MKTNKKITTQQYQQSDDRVQAAFNAVMAEIVKLRQELIDTADRIDASVNNNFIEIVEIKARMDRRDKEMAEYKKEMAIKEAKRDKKTANHKKEMAIKETKRDKKMANHKIEHDENMAIMNARMDQTMHEIRTMDKDKVIAEYLRNQDRKRISINENRITSIESSLNVF